MKDLKELIKDKFDYDVTALPVYVDEQSTEVFEDLIFSSGLTSRINVEENVKGSKTIKLLNADLAIQDASTGCSLADDGSIVFNGTNISVKRIGVQQALCNEDLIDTWGQIMLAAGASRQDRDLPMQDVIISYLIKKIKKKDQDLMFLGDTASVNPDLVHYDGFVKLWDADTNLISATSLETAITDSNAFAIAKTVYDAIPDVLFDNGADVEIITGRTEAQAILNNIYADKDYASSIEVSREGSELSFVLPTTNVRVRSYPQLTGLGKMYAVPYSYMFYGTDLSSDIDGLSVKYLEEQEQLRMRALWRSGVQYVYPEYFVKLVLA